VSNICKVRVEPTTLESLLGLLDQLKILYEEFPYSLNLSLINGIKTLRNLCVLVLGICDHGVFFTQ
jgi:hypothetical protein